MRKDKKEKCSTATAWKSSGQNLKYQLRMSRKISLPVLTEPVQEIQINFFLVTYLKKLVNDEYYILIGIDRYGKWPVVRDVNQPKRENSSNFWKASSTFMEFREK